MHLTRVAVCVAYFHLSLALCAALSEEPEHHALAEQMGVTWSFVPRMQNQELDRRSLRNVHVGSPHLSPSLSESRSRTGGLGVGAIIGIVVSSVCFILVVAGVAVWGCRRKRADPEWGLLGSFKRRNPEVDEENLYAQAKGDTHLSGF